MYKKFGMLVILSFIISAIIFSPAAYTETEGIELADNQSIVRFTNNEEILQVIKEFNANLGGAKGAGSAAAATESKSRQITDTAQRTSDFSQTNVQEQGVDEADTVKTDGEYIFHLRGRELLISKAYPADSFNLLSRTKFDDTFQPREMFIQGKIIAVVGNADMPAKKTDGNQDSIASRAYPRNSVTSVMLYDASDKQNVTFSRQVDLQGNYLSSRIIGQTLYLASSQYVFLNSARNDETKEEQYLPMYRDSTKGQNLTPVDIKEIYHFPEAGSNQYLNLAALQLANPTGTVEISSYLGGGEQLYMSDKNLYIGKSNRPPRNYDPDTWNPETTIYKFAVNKTGFKFKQKGQIPGVLLNQFSMDEHNGFLRVAATKNNFRELSDNNLYVLDANMAVKGKIEGLAKGERIYSVRFMGDRGYVVTFRNTDPLFTIDLKDPANPTVAGELKIPGFSNYLHPYDESHIIGFGRDTEEKTLQPGRTAVVQKGIKLSMFDVTDMQHPKEMFTTVIGDSSTYSELQHNHRALLFSKEKNLLAFPAVQSNDKQSFVGYYVFGVDLKNGFVQKAAISQHSDPKHDYSSQRMLYLGDTVYLISDTQYKFYDVNTLQPVREPFALN